jgi:hypothetical protein
MLARAGDDSPPNVEPPSLSSVTLGVHVPTERVPMQVDWMILANSAETHDGLVSVLGGGWDTVSSTPTPDGPAAVLRGSLVLRLLLTSTETGSPHGLQVKVVDEDGRTIHEIAGEFTVEMAPELPEGWDQGFVATFDITGMALPGPGTYEIAVSADGEFLRAIPFRVMEG